MLMQQVREVMTVNQEMTDESSWIWLTSEQMGFPLRSEFAKENHGEAGGNSQQCNDQRTDQTAFFLAPIITDFIRSTKRELYDKKFEDALEMLDLEWNKDDDTETQCNRLNTSPLHRGNVSNKDGLARVKQRMQWEAPSKLLAVDDPSSASTGTRSACRNRHKLVFRSRHTVTLKRRVCQNLSRLITLGRHLGKIRIRTTEVPTTCMKPHRGWTIASSS